MRSSIRWQVPPARYWAATLTQYLTRAAKRASNTCFQPFLSFCCTSPNPAPSVRLSAASNHVHLCRAENKKTATGEHADPSSRSPQTLTGSEVRSAHTCNFGSGTRTQKTGGRLQYQRSIMAATRLSLVDSWLSSPKPFEAATICPARLRTCGRAIA